MYNLFALCTGFLISIMIFINGTLSNYVGSYMAIFILHLVALVFVQIIMLFKKENNFSKESIPIYLFFGGAIGVFINLFNIMCFKKLGMSLTISLGLLGQTIFSCIIDHFGFLGVKQQKFTKSKIVGFLLLLSGISIMTFYN